MKIDLRQNGYIRIKSQRTGVEVRFHIKTEKQERNLYRKKEKRWLKIGQISAGRVKLTNYHSKRETSRLYRDMLNDPTNPRYGGFSYEQEARCNLCNRKLKNIFSVWRGYGPECAKKMR